MHVVEMVVVVSMSSRVTVVKENTKVSRDPGRSDKMLTLTGQREVDSHSNHHHHHLQPPLTNMPSPVDSTRMFCDYPWGDLKGCVHSGGIAEVKRRFASCMDPISASALDGNLQAAAIAFVTYGQHNAGGVPSLNGRHHLFNPVRGSKADFDAEKAQSLVSSTKDLIFDMVRINEFMLLHDAYWARLMCRRLQFWIECQPASHSLLLLTDINRTFRVWTHPKAWSQTCT